MRQAHAVLTRELQPGERACGSAAVTFSPAAWGGLVLLVIALGPVAAALAQSGAFATLDPPYPASKLDAT